MALNSGRLVLMLLGALCNGLQAEEKKCGYHEVYFCVESLGRMLSIEGHHPTINDNVTPSLLAEMCGTSYPEYMICLERVEKDGISDCKSIQLAGAIKAMMERLCHNQTETVQKISCVDPNAVLPECEVILSQSWIREIKPKGVMNPEKIPWKDDQTRQCIYLKEYMTCIKEKLKKKCGQDNEKWYADIARQSLVPFKYDIQCAVYGPTGGVPGLTSGIIMAIIFAVTFSVFVWAYTLRSGEGGVTKS